MDKNENFGICANCHKKVERDLDRETAFEFYQKRKLDTTTYRIDYQFCSKKCMQAKMKGHLITIQEASAQTAKEIFDELDKLDTKMDGYVCMKCNASNLEDCKDYLALKKKYLKE